MVVLRPDRWLASIAKLLSSRLGGIAGCIPIQWQSSKDQGCLASRVAGKSVLPVLAYHPVGLKINEQKFIVNAFRGIFT
jgi:hypothetical protein